MLIRSLASWAGLGFSVMYGEVIEVTDEVGEARIEAGLAEAVDLEPAAPKGRKVNHTGATGDTGATGEPK